MYFYLSIMKWDIKCEIVQNQINKKELKLQIYQCMYMDFETYNQIRTVIIL